MIEIIFKESRENPDLIFVEIEDGNEKSISIGTWGKTKDGYSSLRIMNGEMPND